MIRLLYSLVSYLVSYSIYFLLEDILYPPLSAKDTLFDSY